VNTYNVRDQITQTRQYAGAEGSGTYQDSTMTYDGYGRLKTKHLPEQTAGANTVYSYNADDTIATITDARGAIATHGYNSRHLLTSITHTLTGQPNVTASFSYDGAGNRSSMTDSLGTTSYSYDELSRLTSETRGFTGLANYTLSYQYNRNNDLISLTSPSNPGTIAVSHTRDSAGRVTSITRPGQTLASAISYRASGVMKHMLYGDNSTMDITFNSRILPMTYNLPGKISKTYSYNDDGTLRFSSDAIDHRFDRSYSFDQGGRIKSALSGAEARNEGTTTNRPYNQTYGYDAFGHMTQRSVKIWWTNDYTISNTYVNNRKTNWQYDADGRPTTMDGYYSYDAAGETITWKSPGRHCRRGH
jgi:YD repeat-containing protein